MRTRISLRSCQASAAIRVIGGATAAALTFASAFQSAQATITSAARDADIEQVREMLSAGQDVNALESDGSSALLWATYQEYPELVKLLLDAGADPNAANEFGITPLLQASRYGDAELIQALLDAGADITITHPSGETALMAAARSGSVEAVTLLLEHGADPNAVEDLQHQTALMWATVEGHLGVVDALLDAGANPNMQARVSELTKRNKADFPSGGFTALMFAARDANESISWRLVEGGADLNLTNGDGATAMMIAIVNDRFDYAKKLLDLGADPNDGSLYQAVLMRDATTDWLAKDGTQWRADYPNELTALDLVRIYLEAGADPNKPFVGQFHSTSMCCDTKENTTPLFRAAVAADVEALKLLIEHGGDVEWAPAGSSEGMGGFGPKTVGRTPLMVAMSGGKGVGMAGGPGDIREGKLPPFREKANREPVDAVKVLLEAGANPDAVTPDSGDAALHFAALDGKLDVIRALAEAGATLDLPNGKGKTALELAEAMPPREPPPTTGALAGLPQGAQPTEVVALLHELMQEER